MSRCPPPRFTRRTSCAGLLAVGCLLVATACSDASPSPGAEASPAGETADQRHQAATPGSGHTGGEADDGLLADEVVMDIDWRSAAATPRLDTERVPRSVRRKLDDAPVPVLLPNRPGMLDDATPIVGRHWYSVSMDLDGADVVLEGDRVARKLDGPVVSEAGARQTDDGFMISRTHGIVSLSFRAHGAAYSLDVECASPDEDPRCTDDTFILELADSLRRLPEADGPGGRP